MSSVLRPHQHSIGYTGEFLQVKRPNQQYQSTEEDATKDGWMDGWLGFNGILSMTEEV